MCISSHYSESMCVRLVQVTHTEETLASNTWSLMLKEVLGSLLKAPEGLFSGLTLLSELLPLPLPMQSTQVSHYAPGHPSILYFLSPSDSCLGTNTPLAP